MPSNIRSGVITLLHTACGAGILAMPFGFRPFGLIMGFIMLTICGICSTTGLLLQSKVTKYATGNAVSFFALSQMVNPKLSVLFDLAIAVKCFGVGVSYMIVVGDLMPQIAHVFTSNALLQNRSFHITMIMAFIVSPLCFLKKLNSLRYASMIAISSVAYLCVLVVVHYLFPSEEIKELQGNISYGLPTGEPSPFTTLPIFVFAYTCHHNMFSVINEQKDTSFRHIMKIPLLAMLLAYVLYIIIGFSGYLTFGDNIVGNIITLYPESKSSTIGRVAIVFLVMLAFPLQCHPARASIHHIIHYIEQTRANYQNLENISEVPLVETRNQDEEATLLAEQLIEEESSEQPQVEPLKGKRFIIITCGILILSYFVAIAVSSLAHVLAIVGATGSTSISFILPGIFGYTLIGSEHNSPGATSTISKSDKIFKYGGLVLLIWGIFVMVASLSATILLGVGH